jgi:hypothetical protein
MRRAFLILLALVGGSVPAVAQVPKTLSALNACHIVQASKQGTIYVQLSSATGTWIATFRGSVKGDTFDDIALTPSSGGVSTSTAATSGTWIGLAYPYVEVCLTTWSSGSVVVTIDMAPSGGGASGGGAGASGEVALSDNGGLTLLSNMDSSLTNINNALAADVSHGGTVSATGPQEMCAFDDVAPATVTEGQAVRVRCSAKGDRYITIRDDAGNERGVNVNASNELLVALSSVPSHAVTNAGTFAVQPGLTGGTTGGAAAAPPICDSQAFLDMTTATTTEIIALTASRVVHICHIRAMANGATVMTFKISTGTNCASPTAIDAAYDLTAQTGFSAGSGVGEVLSGGTAGAAVCVTSSAAVNLHVFMRYAKY